jgi:hypothetical protein
VLHALIKDGAYRKGFLGHVFGRQKR